MGLSVLHVNSYLKDRTFYKGLFEKQIKTGKEVKVFTPVAYNDCGKAKTVGDYVDVVECYGTVDRLTFFLKQFKSIEKAEQLYDFSNINIIHAHSMCTNGYIAYVLSCRHNVPYVITVRNGDLNNIYKKMLVLRPIFNRVIKNASGVIFLSEPYKNDVINNCIPRSMKEDVVKKSFVIPNGIDDYWFENSRLDSKIPNRPCRLIYAGEINKNKNINGLYKAIKMLNKRGCPCTLTIAGEIKDKSLQVYLDSEYVNYVGKVDKSALIELYRNSDIFIMPSHKEAFGLVYAEALTQGLPIIYTKNQGFDNQFDEGTVGYHVNSNSVNDIADKIQMILSNYDNIQNNTVACSKKFKWEQLELIYGKMYDDICFGK